MTPSHAAIFDRTHRRPADKTAAIVVQRGERFESQKKMGGLHWKTQPPTRIDDWVKVDLTGKRYGRLQVIGLHAYLKKRWVVRCACGDYEVRSAKAINNPQNFGDRCYNCRHLAFLKVSHEHRTSGRELDQRKV
jgi:hypothetical protein